MTPISQKKYVLSYIYGLVLSLVLTLGAYGIVAHHVLWGAEAIAALMIFALAQFVVQIVFFLHLGGAPASRERLVVLGFALVVVAILVGGSVWIMQSLSGRMMPNTEQMTQYMNSQQGL